MLVVAYNKVVKFGNQLEFQIVAERVLTANCSELQRSIDDVMSKIIRHDHNLRDIEKREGEVSRIEKQMRGFSHQDSLDDLKQKKGHYETILGSVCSWRIDGWEEMSLMKIVEKEYDGG